MRYTAPSYCRQFHCIGGACPDTCCSGWRIDVDPRSLRRYKAIAAGRPWDPFCRKLKRFVDFRRGAIRLKDRHCPFLTTDRLCQIQSVLGEAALCRTCRIYPRHMEAFGSLREYSLSLSCPEAARIILSQPGRPAMVSRGDGGDAADAAVETAAARWLLAARDIALGLLWEPSPAGLYTKAAMVLAFSHDVQRRLGMEGSLGTDRDLDSLADRYLAAAHEPERFWLQAEKRVASHPVLPTAALWRLACLSLFQSLEPVLLKWPRLISSAGPLPAAGDVAHNPLPRTQLLDYYLRLYLPGAVYDRSFFQKAQFAVVSWLMTEMMAAGAPAGPGSRPGTDRLAAAAYRYSRQVENWDGNLDRILSAMDREREFKFLPLLSVLIRQT